MTERPEIRFLDGNRGYFKLKFDMNRGIELMVATRSCGLGWCFKEGKTSLLQTKAASMEPLLKKLIAAEFMRKAHKLPPPINPANIAKENAIGDYCL